MVIQTARPRSFRSRALEATARPHLDRVRQAWKDFLHSPQAAVLTHGSLLGMTALLVTLLVIWPGWWVLVPCVLITHRIGMLVHEYVHCIPFRKRSHNVLVVAVWDAVLIAAGGLICFRALHLRHHSGLNGERDPAIWTERRLAPMPRWKRMIFGLELLDNFHHVKEIRAGRSPIKIPRRRLYLAVACSGLHALAWVAIGLPHVPLGLAGCSALATAVGSSLRGAAEHHGPRGSTFSTNDYRPLLWCFNFNRHRDHHRHPGRPWYRLQYSGPPPLPRWGIFVYWWKVYVTGEYGHLAPQREGEGAATEDAAWGSSG